MLEEHAFTNSADDADSADSADLADVSLHRQRGGMLANNRFSPLAREGSAGWTMVHSDKQGHGRDHVRSALEAGKAERAKCIYSSASSRRGGTVPMLQFLHRNRGVNYRTTTICVCTPSPLRNTTRYVPAGNADASSRAVCVPSSRKPLYKDCTFMPSAL